MGEGVSKYLACGGVSFRYLRIRPADCGPHLWAVAVNQGGFGCVSEPRKWDVSTVELSEVEPPPRATWFQTCSLFFSETPNHVRMHVTPGHQRLLFRGQCQGPQPPGGVPGDSGCLPPSCSLAAVSNGGREDEEPGVPDARTCARYLLEASPLAWGCNPGHRSLIQDSIAHKCARDVHVHRPRSAAVLDVGPSGSWSPARAEDNLRSCHLLFVPQTFNG